MLVKIDFKSMRRPCAGELGDSVVKDSWKVTRAAVRRMFGRDRESTDGNVPMLSAPQLERVRQLAFAKSRELKLSETRASLLADAIVGRVGKTIVLALPLGLGKANHIANALYAKAAADRSIRLTIFTALTLEPPRAHQEL